MFNFVDGQKLAEFKREKYSNLKKKTKSSFLECIWVIIIIRLRKQL